MAEAIEALYSRDLDPHLLALGIHYREGEIWDRAAIHFSRAGYSALGRSATVESVMCFEHAVEAVNRLPATDEGLRLGTDVRTGLRYPLSQLGRVSRLGTILDEAARMASQLADRRREALVASGRCHYFHSVGDNERAREAGELAVSLARDVGDRELEGEATYYAGLTLMVLGHYHAAAGPIRGLVEFLESGPRPARPARWGSAHALACAFLARCLAEVGEFSEALAFGERGLRRAEECANPFHLATTRFGLGSAYLRKGDFGKAIAQLCPSLELIEGHGIDIFLPAVSASLGLALAYSGQAAEGLALLDRALRRSRLMNISAGCARLMAYRGEAYLLAGQVPEARQWAEAALQHARGRRERGHEAIATRLLGEVSARQGVAGLTPALTLYEEALTQANDLRMRPLAALCHLSLGRVLQERNHWGQAALHRDRATEMLEQMDMRFWLGSATAQAGPLREPAIGPPRRSG